MPTYKLKEGQDNFSPVSGAYAGRRYEKGATYIDIPPKEAARFEEIITEPAPSVKKVKTADQEAAK